MDRKPYSPRIVVFLLALCMAACGPLIAEQNVEALNNATSLKTETLAMIAQSGDQYSAHQADVDALKAKLVAAEQFAAGLPKNKLSARQWKVMNDPNGNMAGGYWRIWESKGTLDADFITFNTRQIGRGFDQIICLEQNKGSETACPE